MSAAVPARVVVPDPDAPPLGLVLTCGSAACRHVFEPDPIAFAMARLACPRCGGWTFQAELVEHGHGGRRRCGTPVPVPGA